MNNRHCFEQTEERSLQDLRQRERGRPLKIVFISHLYTYWNLYASVLRALMPRPDLFEPVVLAVPYIGKDADKLAHIRHPLQELREAGFPLVSPDKYNLKRTPPDLAFFSNPYTAQRDLKYHPGILAALGTRSALIPYCTEFMGDEEFLHMYHASVGPDYWRIFSASGMSSRTYALMLDAPEWAVPALGNPEYDQVVGQPEENLKKFTKIKELAQGRKIVLWTPHYRNASGWATWEYMGTELAEIFRRAAEDIFLVLRPHQLITRKMREWRPGLPATDKLWEIMKILHESGNYWLDDEGPAIESVYAADAVVSDMSSILTKAMALGKSTLFTYGSEGSGAGLAKNVLSTYIHNASTPAELHKFLQMIIAGQADPLLPVPKAVRSSFCGPADGKSGARIANYLESYFFNQQN